MAKKIALKSNYSGTLTLEVLEGAHRYNSWIAEKILPHIEPPVLEVGAGIGNISSFFLDKKPLTLTDVDDMFVSHLSKKFKGVKTLKLDITRSPNSFLIGKHGTVVAINTLEHIEKDEEALINLKKTLKKKGRIVLLVPAKKKAFNKLDKELGHFRRYEKKELINKLKSAGFEVESVKFFNVLGLVTWIVRNYLTGQNVHLTSRQIAMFDLIVPFLKRIESDFPMPIGISLIAVARYEK